MALLAGTEFAGYTIVRGIGAGGMGEVYLAEHPRLPRRDALKILPEAFTGNHEFRGRFVREADLAAGLWHPHIVGVHDRGEFDGRLWIAMDYVDGCDASQLVRTKHPAGMPVAEVTTIVSAIAGALDYAHQRGLLHRDVKPGNILIESASSGPPRIALSDFGIAREIVDSAGLTATNLTVGTVAYAAPEQLMGQSLDGRADQYALAATTYHLLTGSAPFSNSNPAAVIGQHLTATPPKLSALRPQLAALDEVLGKALSKAPADRFATCAEFASALLQAENDASRATVRRHVAATPAAIQAQENRRPRVRRRRVAILSVATVLIATVVAMGTYIRSHPATHVEEVHPMAATAPLDGTFRVQYHSAQSTFMGAPSPRPDDDSVRWWAMRTGCNQSTCFAIGMQLDSEDHSRLQEKALTLRFQLVDGNWNEFPRRERQDLDTCSIGENGTLEKGQDTTVTAWQLRPQPDGSFQGTLTMTAITGECGRQAIVYQTPFTAERFGDNPSGITIPDPITDELPPVPETVPGPVLAGMYELTLDIGQTRSDGTFSHGDEGIHEWRAYRSRCIASGCVATAAVLDSTNPTEAAGPAGVLRLIDGQWKETEPPLRVPCESDNTREHTTERSLTLKPLPDGTLSGTFKYTITSNECGGKGSWFEVPVTAVRKGEVPATVMVADPALFG
ncbi:serine/threonine-protein kinase [Mycolicibacter heraklionensis]|uniref:serine/threonine-protein kinase n=1 Tax=Mycolicibacter heraklionensis TaxID=512402 RepID=UPI0009E223A8|nr:MULTISPECIES: serine/threonine-protein kinase [Mycobacteriaceae]